MKSIRPKWLAAAFPVRDMKPMHDLKLHPACAPGSISSVTASISPTKMGCRALFRLHGDLREVRIPELSDPERMDNLWKTTCFEIFWQPEGERSYREFNLSPSHKWAAYDFDDFRKNGRDAPVDAIASACAHSHELLILTADIAAELPVPAMIALNAITEDRSGTLQYWALNFRDGPAEFHSEECRALRLESRP